MNRDTDELAAIEIVTKNQDLLSDVSLFLDMPEISAVCRTCKIWKRSVQTVEEELWEGLVKKYHPSLERLRELLPPQEATSPKCWKLLFQRRMVSPWKAEGFNQQLQTDFATMFRHEGIVAFSNCCHYGCSDTYKDEDSTFVGRRQGVGFVRIHLNGMNYDETPTLVAAYYSDFDYLMENWESECKLLVRWCGVLGLKPGEFTIKKPESEKWTILINFLKEINLEEPVFSEDDSEDDTDLLD